LSTAQNKSEIFLTTGQTAKSLRISVSTLKRWVQNDLVLKGVKQNANGWRLFSTKDLQRLKSYQKLKRKIGKTYKPSTLKPVE